MSLRSWLEEWFGRPGKSVLRVNDGRMVAAGYFPTLPTAGGDFRYALAADANGVHVCQPDGAGWAWQYAGQLGATLALGPWFARNLATSTADQGFALPYMPTNTSIGEAGTTPGNGMKMPRAGRVVGMILNANAARTAGTATGRVDIAGSTSAIGSGGCVLNGTDTAAASVWDESGPTFTAGQNIRPVVTTASWTPTTADVTAWLVVRLAP